MQPRPPPPRDVQSAPASMEKKPQRPAVLEALADADAAAPDVATDPLPGPWDWEADRIFGGWGAVQAQAEADFDLDLPKKGSGPYHDPMWKRNPYDTRPPMPDMPGLPQGLRPVLPPRGVAGDFAEVVPANLRPPPKDLAALRPLNRYPRRGE